MVPRDVLLCYDEEGCRRFLEKIWGLSPTYVCVIGSTETAKIPGISAAGKNPELTDYTPAADVELLLYGECRCIEGVPVTPEGIPTPALITLSAVQLAEMPVIVVDGGAAVKPHAPYVDVGGRPGGNIREGRGVDRPETVFERARTFGKHLARISDYIVVGESIPGGTTTALGLLTAMGYDAIGKVSSSMPSNPHELKARVVSEGLKAAGKEPGAFRGDPLGAASVLGDPMMVAFAGLVAGAAPIVPVLMAGGTQMAAVLAILKELAPDALGNVAIGTTRWIVEDRSSDIVGLVSQIARVPVLAAGLSFKASRHWGLRVYEEGAVKEGVGAGGAVIAAIAKLKGRVGCSDVFRKVEENYERILRMR